MFKLKLLGFLIFLLFSNCKISGKYAYRGGFYESIELRSDNTFDSFNANDVGESKRYGIYEIKKGKIKLTYLDPPIKNDFVVLIDTLDFIKELPSKFTKLYNTSQSFIELSIIDKATKQPVNYGSISYYNLEGIYIGGATYSFFDSPFRFSTKYLNFPLSLKIGIGKGKCGLKIFESKNSIK